MKNIKTTNMDSGAKTDIKAIRKPKDIHAGVGELEERLERLLGLFRNVPTTSIGCGEESAFQAVQNVIDSLNRALSTYEVLANQCFVSELIDEWLKDSHCLDNQNAWDADPKRPFPYGAIMEFAADQGLSNISDLGFLMVHEAMSRILDIGQSAGLCTCCVVQSVGQVSLKECDRNAFTKERLVDNGMDENDAEVFLRSVSLYLNVIRGDWPFEYVGLSKTSDDKSKDSERGQP